MTPQPTPPESPSYAPHEPVAPIRVVSESEWRQMVDARDWWLRQAELCAFEGLPAASAWCRQRAWDLTIWLAEIDDQRIKARRGVA